MGVLGWVVAGFVAGTFAQMATGQKTSGCLGTILIGILGGLLGGFVFDAVTGRGIGEFGLWSIFVAFVGASGLLLVFGNLFGPQRRP